MHIIPTTLKATYTLVSLTLHVISHLWRVHAHYSPQLVER
jgi:hypothetical protein